MARGGAQPMPSTISPVTMRPASSRVNQRTASSSLSSGAAWSWLTSAIRPIISCEGKGHGWLEW